MQVSGFKKTFFGFDAKEVISYMETTSKDIETKFRNKDDEIRDLKNKVAQKNAAVDICTRDLESQKTAFESEIAMLKAGYEKEKLELISKYERLETEYSIEKLKIGKAILSAEESATELINKAKETANEIVKEAYQKAEAQKEKYRQSKADVSDFTYDIKKLLDKLTSDIKSKIGEEEQI